MARGRGRPRNPAAQFERIVGTRKGGPREPRLTLAGQPGQPAVKKPYKDMTEEERFLYKRERWLVNIPRRLEQTNKQLNLIVKLANGEGYKFSTKEVESLVAHFFAWADLIEKSFQARKPLSTVNIPPVAYESTEAVRREDDARPRRRRRPPPSDDIPPLDPALGPLW